MVVMVVDGGSQAGKSTKYCTAPAMKSALQGPQSIAPATKFAPHKVHKIQHQPSHLWDNTDVLPFEPQG